MRVLGCLPLLALCLVLPADEKKSEIEAFQGEWRRTKLMANGKQLDVSDGPTMVFKGDRIFVEGEERFTIKIDPACDPKTIDLIPKENKEQVIEGIYRISGTKLTICFRPASRIRMRPLKFGEEKSIVLTLEKAE